MAPLYILVRILVFHATKTPKCELTNNMAKPSIQLCHLHVRSYSALKKINSSCFLKPNNLAEG